MKPIDLARKMRRHPTDAEQHLWQRLRGRSLGGYKFRRQHPMETYICDFVCLEQKLIVEVDGGQHATAQDRDQNRTDALAAQGYRVIRFWNHEVLAKTEAVLERILDALEESRARR